MDLPPFDQISGEYSEFFSEGLGEMAEIGKPDLASGLLDADLAVAQQFPGALQAALIIIIV